MCETNWITDPALSSGEWKGQDWMWIGKASCILNKISQFLIRKSSFLCDFRAIYFRAHIIYWPGIQYQKTQCTIMQYCALRYACCLLAPVKLCSDFPSGGYWEHMEIILYSEQQASGATITQLDKPEVLAWNVMCPFFPQMLPDFLRVSNTLCFAGG